MINSPWLWLGVPGIFYAVQAIRYYYGMHRIGMCMAFIGYTFANLGLIIDEYEQKVS